MAKYLHKISVQVCLLISLQVKVNIINVTVQCSVNNQQIYQIKYETTYLRSTGSIYSWYNISSAFHRISSIKTLPNMFIIWVKVWTACHHLHSSPETYNKIYTLKQIAECRLIRVFRLWRNEPNKIPITVY